MKGHNKFSDTAASIASFTTKVPDLTESQRVSLTLLISRYVANAWAVNEQQEQGPECPTIQ